jgi:hypothetical protein
MKPDYDKAPRHAQSYERYVERGGHVGDFLTMVLQNDLAGAVGHADSTNRDLLTEHVRFVFNELPADCWGSESAVKSWVAHDGLEGKPEP